MIFVKIELINTHKCKCQYSSYCFDNPVNCLITLFFTNIDPTFLNFNNDFCPGWRGRTRDVAIEWAHWRERKVQSIPCCNCSVPACYCLPHKWRGCWTENCLFIYASWLEEISRRQADLLSTQAAADKLQECVHKLTAENDVLKVLMVFSDSWRFCNHELYPQIAVFLDQ